MNVCPFNTNEINKLIVWFCVPIELQEQILLKCDTIYDRNMEILFLCFNCFQNLLEQCNMQIEEDTVYDMYVMLTKVIVHKTPPNRLKDFTIPIIKNLLEELLEIAQESK